MSKTRKTRGMEQAIEINAKPEDVWKAIAESDGIKNWFAFDARVRPGIGGEVFVSWGPDCEGGAPIDVWEPGRRYRWVEARPPMGKDGVPVQLSVEFEIEARGGGTVLRIVTAGFGNDASWDDEFDSMSRGWEVFQRGLKHYLERHNGAARRVAYAEIRSESSVEEAWGRITGTEGLAREGTLAGLEEGGRYSAVTADGDRLGGAVHVFNAPKDLAVTVEEWNDAHLWVECNRTKQGSIVKLTVSTYGVPAATASAIEARWKTLLARLFPAPANAEARSADAATQGA